MFRLANINDLDRVFELIVDRVKWMDDMHLKQWNINNYLEAYPKEYYAETIKNKALYVLEKDKILGASVIFKEDINDDEVYYIHNLVTDLNHKGIGKLILKEIEHLAIQNNIKYLRLDCDKNNEILNEYYEELGFRYIGICQEGLYIGNIREKILE